MKNMVSEIQTIYRESFASDLHMVLKMNINEA